MKDRLVLMEIENTKKWEQMRDEEEEAIEML